MLHTRMRNQGNSVRKKIFLSQKINFKPNWRTRGPPSPRRGLPASTSGVVPIAPKAPLSTCTFGRLKLGWLRILKNSVRNCSETRSLILVFLLTEKSSTLKRGPTMIFRPALPKLPVAGICHAGVSPARQVLRLLPSAFKTQGLIHAATVRPPL